MKTSDKVFIVVAIFLVLALLVGAMAVLNEKISPEGENFFDSIGNLFDKADETTDTSSPDTDDSGLVDGGVDTDDYGSDSENYTPHTLTFGMGETTTDIFAKFIQNTNQEFFAVGIATDKLKANTSYRLEIEIDEDFYTVSNTYIPSEEYEGEEKEYFLFSENLILGIDGANQRHLVFSDLDGKLYYNFNSGASGDLMSLFIAYYDNPGNSISFEDFPNRFGMTTAQMKDYVQVTITEVK